MAVGNSIQNNGLNAILQKAPQNVVAAIKSASAKTGVDFAYLVEQAGAESGFKANAKAKTSSASGLYQFIESTWLSMVDKYGAKHGIETEGQTRGQLLALRNDPSKAAAMAAEFAGENERSLRANYGGDIGSTELYFAHFLGAGQASAFLNARAENPDAPASVLFPAAAKANKNVFYDRTTGRAKSLDEVYGFFDRKFSASKGQGAEVADVAGMVDVADMTGVAPVSAGFGQDAASSILFNGADDEKNRLVGIDDLYAMMSDSAQAALGSGKDTAPSGSTGSALKLYADSHTPVRASSRTAGYIPTGSLGTFSNLVANPIEIMMMAKLDMPVRDARDRD